MNKLNLIIHKSTLTIVYNHLENLRDLMYNNPSKRKVYDEVWDMVFNGHYERMMMILDKTINDNEVA